MMKKVGIIGGLSPESTKEYCDGLNAGVKEALGGNHNAKMVVSYVDFQDFIDLKQRGDWDEIGKALALEAGMLEKAGCDFIILSTNTMHKVADYIDDIIGIPFLHLADATAHRIVREGIRKVGLLGTRYTMEMDFYKKRLQDQRIEVLVPDEAGRKIVNDVIYDELCKGFVHDESRVEYQKIIQSLKDQGAEGVVLGCTEITLLIQNQSQSALPIFDTTSIHIENALNMILKG